MIWIVITGICGGGRRRCRNSPTCTTPATTSSGVCSHVHSQSNRGPRSNSDTGCRVDRCARDSPVRPREVNNEKRGENERQALKRLLPLTQETKLGSTQSGLFHNDTLVILALRGAHWRHTIYGTAGCHANLPFHVVITNCFNSIARAGARHVASRGRNLIDINSRTTFVCTGNTFADHTGHKPDKLRPGKSNVGPGTALPSPQQLKQPPLSAGPGRLVCPRPLHILGAAPVLGRGQPQHVGG